EFPAELAITRIPDVQPPMFTAYLRDITGRKRSDEVLAQRLKLLALTADVSKSLAVGDTARDMLQGFAEALVKHLDAALARIWLYDPEAQVLELKASAGVFTQIDAPHARVPLGELKIGRIGQSRTPYLTNSVVGNPLIVDQEWARQNHLVAFAGYPLLVDDELVGVMGVYAAHDLADDTLDVMQSVAHEVAVAVDRQRAIRAAREREQQFRMLAETIPQLAWMTGPDGSIEWYNQRWYQFTGTTPEEMLGWGWQTVHDPAELPRVLAKFQEAIASGEPWEDAFPLRRHDGVFRWHLSRAQPLRDADGKIVHWFGTNTDITEQRELAENLRILAAELSEANRRKTEFLATLAHELRNPLAPIRTGLELMKLAPDDRTTLEEARSMMERQALQMVRLIDDLLDVARITQGKLQLRKSPIDLADVLNTSIEASSPLIDESGHKLTVDAPKEPIALVADPSRLAQVISNLLNNAAKYTAQGGRIWLTVRREGETVVISVKDTGMGIPPDMQHRVFEMFAQIDGPLERGYTGLGIGLTLVKRIVEMHGGTIEVQSAGANQGSEFIVRLPLSGEEAGSGLGQRSPAEDTAPLPPTRILVVDDNKDAAEMLRGVLTLLGHEVRVVHDGVAAVAAAEQYRPRVVLMDLGMPRMNGFEAAQQIRQQPWGQKMVLVALTGWGQLEDRQRSQAAGFDYHVTKAADPEVLQQLLATIAQQLDGPEQTCSE
ncbi:MAG: response regulator, partial [Planctomycetaceae bacterium]|nr:response regulator [Planctomycetaceae bacterium]